MSYGATFTQWRAQAGTLWPAYTRHEFVEGLGDGTLPRDAFLRYLAQDYLFLIHFSRAWALAITKADTLEEMQHCAATVQALLGEEISLHVEVCAAEGISEADLFAAQEADATIAYTRYVLDAGHSGDFLDLLAALAPCVMGYGEIGQRLAAQPHAATYANWIAAYSSAGYQQTCADVGALLDKAVQRRLGLDPTTNPRWPALCSRFTTATRLEVSFWQMGLIG